MSDYNTAPSSPTGGPVHYNNDPLPAPPPLREGYGSDLGLNDSEPLYLLTLPPVLPTVANNVNAVSNTNNADGSAVPGPSAPEWTNYLLLAIVILLAYQIFFKKS